MCPRFQGGLKFLSRRRLDTCGEIAMRRKIQPLKFLSNEFLTNTSAAYIHISISVSLSVSSQLGGWLFICPSILPSDLSLCLSLCPSSYASVCRPYLHAAGFYMHICFVSGVCVPCLGLPLVSTRHWKTTWKWKMRSHHAGKERISQSFDSVRTE